jgi:neutral ceramidase
MDNRLYCGAGTGVITPSEELMANLRGLGNRSFGGVLDGLFVRVIAVSNGENKALMIAFDLDKALYPAENLAIISKRTGIPENNIFFFSTHTHTAPITGYRPEEPVNNVRLKVLEVQEATSKYEKQVTDTMLKAVDEAVGSMRLAKMGYASEKSHINVNRSQDYEYTDENGELHTECCLGVNLQAPVDLTLFVMMFEDLNGQPIAFFMNYPVHNCVMLANRCCGGKTGISGDIGGKVCGFLEEKYAGCTAIWSSGAAGDVNPLMSHEIYYPDPKTGQMVFWEIPGGDTSKLTMLAARHFADVMKAIRKIICITETAPIAGRIDWVFTPERNVVRRDNGSTEIIVGEGVDRFDLA